MSTQIITVTRLADLRSGDRIKSWDGHQYNPPRLVILELGTIAAGSPVEGVRLQNPNLTSPIELVLYPAQMDGRILEVERDTPCTHNNTISGNTCNTDRRRRTP